MSDETLHASAARVGVHGVLVRGASGSGKSSLVLALIYGAGATLVADDQVVVFRTGDRLMASAPEALAGRMEVRGVGIIEQPHTSPVAVDLVVDLVPLADCPRMPDETEARVAVAGAMLRRIFVAAGAADGAWRVCAALAGLQR